MIMPVAALQPPLLFAAGFDWLEAILPILFVGFWILSQVFAVFRRVAGGPARPPVVRLPDAAREAPRQPPPPLPRDGDPRAELERQIADFLRQVTGETPAAKPQPPRQSPQPLVEPTRRPQPVAPAAKAPRPAAPAAMPVSERASGARQVGSLDMGPSAVARHVQDAFAHKLGHLHSGLESRTDEPAQAKAARRVTGGGLSARDLVDAARDPATIRQAILLREILERPVDRW